MSKHAAQAHGLMGARLYIAVAACAKKHDCFAGLNNPVAVFLKLLRRTLKLRDVNGGFVYLRVVCHTLIQ